MVFFVLKNFILEITADLADINIFFVVYSHPDLDLLFAVLTLRCLCTSKDMHAQTKYCDGCLQFLFDPICFCLLLPPCKADINSCDFINRLETENHTFLLYCPA